MRLWKPKEDHPRLLFAVFVREKVAGKKKHEPRLAMVTESPLAGLVGSAGKGRDALAKDLNCKPGQIEIAAYVPDHDAP